MLNSILTAFALLATLNLFSQDGTLDNTFGSGGKVTTIFGSYDDYGSSVAIQSDGKIVAAGSSGTGTLNDFALVRYNTNGSLDNSFSSDGKVSTDFGSDEFGNSVAIQSDGKIVLAGYSTNGSSNRDFALVRYNTDGSLDNSFSTDGKVTTELGGDDVGSSVAIQGDGKIVVVGSSGTGAFNDFALVRYNADGSLDNTFSTDGKVTTDVGSGSDEGNSVAIQSDGKIVLAGYSITGTNFNYDFALVRYNADGSLDNSFSTDGKVITDFGNIAESGQSVAIQSDGKIVVAGSSGDGSNSNFALVRYNINGSLDNSFSTDGIVTTDFGNNDFGYSVVIQSDGKIVVVGSSGTGVLNDFALVRYNAAGSLDNSFSTDGKVNTKFGSYDAGSSVAIQSDGKIVVVGTSYNSTTSNDFAMTRYNNSSSGIINTLSRNGLFAIAPNPTNGIFTIQSKGKAYDIQSVEVYNMLGEKIYTSLTDKAVSDQIDISSSLNGLYIVKIVDGESSYLLKVVKE